MTLLKLMYLADREALRLWGAPITNDRYVSMKLGPVLSGVYDLLVVPRESATYWDRHISAPEKYHVRLIGDPGDDRLAAAEDELLDTIFEKYGGMSQWALSELTHEFPEWEDPNGSSKPIQLSSVLKAVGVREDDAIAMARELESFSKVEQVSRS